MSSAVILQQVAHEGPGRIVPVLRDFGIPCQIRHLYRGDEVPSDLDEIRILIVLGGPMSVTDITGGQGGAAGQGGKYPFLVKEVETLQRMIAFDRPVLGICLGAQLLAHAAGAKVYPNVKSAAAPTSAATPHAPVTLASPASSAPPAAATPAPPALPAPEFGWGPVSFPFPGGTEPIVFGLHDGAPMFHWHYDTFDLPRLPAPPIPGAAAPAGAGGAAGTPAPPATPAPISTGAGGGGGVLLSSTRACKNQAFRFKNRLFGFQYHFEFAEADIEALLAHGKEELIKVLGPDAEAKIREQTPKNYPRYARLGNRILTNFVQFLRTY